MLFTQGRIQDFDWGGGGGAQNIMCVCTHTTSAKSEVPYGRVQGSFGFFMLARLSCYSEPYFQVFRYKIEYKIRVEQNLGAPSAPPLILNPPLRLQINYR